MHVPMNIFMLPHLPSFPLGLPSLSPSPWVSGFGNRESKDKLSIP